MENLQSSRRILENSLGPYLINYVEKDDSLPEGWKWRSFSSYTIPREEVVSLQRILMERYITFTDHEDMLI